MRIASYPSVSVTKLATTHFLTNQKVTSHNYECNVYLLDIDELAVLVFEQGRDERIQNVLHTCPLQPGRKKNKLD